MENKSKVLRVFCPSCLREMVERRKKDKASGMHSESIFTCGNEKCIFSYLESAFNQLPHLEKYVCRSKSDVSRWKKSRSQLKPLCLNPEASENS
jgi:ribosomal protein S27E